MFAESPEVYQAVSPAVLIWQALIGAVVTIVIAYMQMRTKQAIEKTSEDAAKKAEEVKDTLKENSEATHSTLSALVTVARQTHSMIDGGMLAQKKIAALLARKLADLDPTNPANLRAALEAEKLYQEHQAAQEKTDAKEVELKSSPQAFGGVR